MNPTARAHFGRDTTAAEVIEGIDLTGKLALVTGASSGIGVETARALASAGAAVVITARDVAKGERVAAEIRKSTGNPAVSVMALELGSLEKVRDFAERFMAAHDTLDILINNAGVMACPLGTTADGFERQFGTNHLGHFLLTELLVPTLLRGAPSRVVSVSSFAHRRSPVVFEDIHYRERPYDKWKAYGQSKTANILFALELERRLGEQGVHAYAIHPGRILTELQRHMTDEDREMFKPREKVSPRRSVEAGAATSVYAATAPELEGRGGVYLEDCHVAEIVDDDAANRGVKSYAVDPSAARRLWQLSEELVRGQS